MIINRQGLDAAFKGFNTLYQKAFESQQVDWEMVAMTVMSTGSEETFGWLGQTTQFREWVGSRVVQALKSHDYTIKNKKFENTVAVKGDHIKDDKLGVYTPLFQMLGEDAKMHPEQLVFALLTHGASNLCYDGQYFFDTDHPVGDGSVSNLTAGTGPAWFLLDTTRAVKPLIFQKREDYKLVAKDKDTDDNVFDRDEYVYGVDARVNTGYALWQMAHQSNADLTPESYKEARAAMMNIKKDNGQSMGIRPSLLVVPPELEYEANEVIKADRLENGKSNVQKGTAKVLVTSYL